MIHVAGATALGLILLVLGAAAIGLLGAGGASQDTLPWDYIAGVVRFTLFQSAASTVLSMTGGMALALALARREHFFGRGAFIAALNLASVLPAIVAVFGVVAVFGRAGWVGAAGRIVGFDPGVWLYGLPGIVITHMFFNVPLAARITLASLVAVPGEHWRLAAQLGMSPGAIFRWIDLPVLRREAPGLAALIFLLCFTSFAVVLALGGGPGAATLEVAIYEAVRFEADVARAGVLALIQVAICSLAAVPIIALARRPDEISGTGIGLHRPDLNASSTRLFDCIVLTAAAILVLPPLAAVITGGLAALHSLADRRVAEAALTSFAIGLAAAVLAIALAVALATWARRLRLVGRPKLGASVTVPGALVLAVPPVALSAGLFVVLRPIADPFALALPLVVLVNALMALPFALRQLEPPLLLSAERYGRLADSLGISGAARIRLVDWPLVRGPVGAAFAVAFALSLGDLGVTAFFGSGTVVTLPLLIHERMGAYRMEEAASVALLLAILVLVSFVLAQRWAGGTLARSR